MQAIQLKSGSVLAWGGVPSRRSRTLRMSASDPKSEPSQQAQQQDEDSPPTVAELPKTGYFAIADTKREVYSKAGEKFDPTARPGRFKSDFIWNTDWQKALQMEESLQRQRDEAIANAAKAENTAPVVGAVSFSRLRDLDRMDVDLTDALKPRPKPQQPDTNSSASNGQDSRQPVMRTVVPLPRNDAKKLERVGRIVKAMNTTVVSTKAQDLQALAEKVAQERAKFEADKMEQRTWSSVFAVLGSGITYAMYGREIGISYVLGALGGIFYLRLLGKSVDGYGSEDTAASAAAQPRLLIPIILALFYNRWNTLYAEDYNVHLNLLAIMVGFLTYKIAVISKQAKEVMDDLTAQNTNKSI